MPDRWIPRLSPWSAARLTVGTMLILCTGSAVAAQSAGSARTAKELVQAVVVFDRARGEAAEEFELQKQRLVEALTGSIATGILTTPLGGSSAGFTYDFDPLTGESSLRSSSFGPLFMDRPLSNGARVLNVGLSFQRTAYRNLLGSDIRERGLLLNDNRVLYTSDGFEQFIEQYVLLEPTVTTTLAYVSYGVTNRFDAGVVVPFSTIDLKATRSWDYDISKTYPVVAGDRAFFTPGPAARGFVQDEGSVSARGIGDVTLRMKYALGPQRGQGAAALFDLRLPTGDEDNLLGTGEVGGRLGIAASKSLTDSASFHANGGFSFGGINDEVSYAFGLEAALLADKNLTVSFELLGQRISDSINGFGANSLGPVTTSDSRFTPAESVLYRNDRLFFESGAVNVVRGAVGAKLLLGTRYLLTGGLLIPLDNTGLHPTVTPFIGLDASWSRRTR